MSCHPERVRRNQPWIDDEFPACLCEHANECPSICPCPPNCYCKRVGSAPSCRPRAAEPSTQVVSTLVIKTVEKDVRLILEFMDQQYTNDELRQAMKRLRRWVGYSK